MIKDKLKQLRIEKGLTQKELAERIFVSRSTIAKWENGIGVPSNINLEELSKYFNVDKEYLTKEDTIEENNKINIDDYISNKFKQNLLTIILAIIMLVFTIIYDSSLFYVIELFLFVLIFLIYDFLRFRQINLRCNDDFINKKYDEVLEKIKKELRRSITIGEVYFCIEWAIDVFMLKGEETKVLYLFDAYPKIKKRPSLAYIQLILSVARKDQKNIDYYYNEVQKIKNHKFDHHKKNAKMLMAMLNTKTFSEELYNSTNMPLLKQICESIKNNKEDVLVYQTEPLVLSTQKTKGKYTILFNVLGIVSLWVGLMLWAIPQMLAKPSNTIETFYIMEKYSKMMYLALPLPVSCMIYGIVSHKKHKTKSCIIIGIIFSALLIIYGSIGFMSNNTYSQDEKYLTYIESKTLIEFPEDATIFIQEIEGSFEGYIEFPNDYEEYVMNNKIFTTSLTEEYRSIVSQFALMSTLEYNYFYLKQIDDHEYIYLAYDIKSNKVYVSKFSK